MRLTIKPTGEGGYYLTDFEGSSCVPTGVPGSFTVAYGHAFWVDKAGVLSGMNLKSGQMISWGSVNLPEKIGGPGAKAFTNTKPAVDAYTAPDGSLQGTVWVTLRNYIAHAGEKDANGNTLSLTGCPPQSPYVCPGAPGALVGVDLATGQIRAHYRQPMGVHEGAWFAANTDPLILKSLNAVVYGDANGFIRSRPLDPHGDEALAALFAGGASDEKLTDRPMRGTTFYHQVSGAGTDPMVASGSFAENAGLTWMMMGVNELPPPNERNSDNAWRHGKLVMIPFGQTANLKWVGAGTKDPPTPWKEEQEVTVGGTVTFERTSQQLGEFRQYPPGVRVTWYVVPQDWNYDASKVIRLGESDTGPLPETLRANQTVDTTKTFVVTEAHPDQGTIYGVIDAERLALDPTRHEGRLAALLLGGPAPAAYTLTSTEMVRLPDGRNGLEDNFIPIPYTKKLAVDLSVDLTLEPNIACSASPRLRPTLIVRNDSKGPVENVVVHLLLTGASAGQQRRWSASVPAMQGGQEIALRPEFSVACGGTYELTAEVNPRDATGARPIPETDESNNTDRATAALGAYQASTPTLKDGEGDVTIVHDECEMTDDITSDKPCDNLDVRVPGD